MSQRKRLDTAGRRGRSYVYILAVLLVVSPASSVLILSREAPAGEEGTTEHQQTLRKEGVVPSPLAPEPAASEFMESAVQALLKADKPPRFYEGAARLFMAHKEPDAALRLMEKAIEGTEEDRDKSHLLGKLAILQMRADDVDGAIATFRRAIELGPDVKQRVRLSNGLGRVAEQEEKLDFAAEAYMYVAKNADTDLARRIGKRSLFRIYEKQGTLAERIGDVKKELEARPDDVAALETLVDYFVRVEKKPELAIPYQERIAKVLPREHSQLRHVADICLQASQYDKALEVLHRGLEAEPHRSILYYERISQALQQKGDREEARQWAMKIAESRPDDPRMLMRAANLLQAMGDADQALDLMEKAIAQAETDTQRAHFYLSAAGMADRLARLDRAETYYKKILETTDDGTLRRRAELGLQMIASKRSRETKEEGHTDKVPPDER